MTTYHPLTETILGHIDTKYDMVDTDAIDAAIVEHLAPPTYLAESGVRFPQHPETKVDVQASFIESGNQVQMALIGTEPVLLVQPEYDHDENKVTFVVAAVDLPPAGLVQTLETLLDAARAIVEQDQ